MIRIVIEDNNGFYKHSIGLFIQDVFLRATGRKVELLPLTESNSAIADVIVKYFAAGEPYICHPGLCFRKSDGLLIGVYEGEVNPFPSLLPAWGNNIVVINRTEDLAGMEEVIIRGWESRRPFIRCCQPCSHRILSPKQLKVASSFYKGNSSEMIAADLQVNVKTVYSHKRSIMEKFKLSSDCELLCFMDILHNGKCKAACVSDVHKRISVI